MVSQTNYNGQSNDNRRPSRAYPPYMSEISHHERRSQMARENRSIVMAERQTEAPDAPVRKRIAVACGRCRQRKIRCSGDLGQNMPCSNCKNAGIAQCLFLRVSSRETPIKGEANNGGNNSEFDYNPIAARALAQRSAVSSGPQYAGPHGFSNDFYRTGDLLPYTYGSKSYHMSLPGWSSGFGGDYGSYSVPENCGNGSYSVMNDDQISCSWERAKLSQVGSTRATNILPEEGGLSKGGSPLAPLPEVTNSTAVVTGSPFHSDTPAAESAQMERLQSIPIRKVTHTVREASYGDNVLSCFKSTGSSPTFFAISAAIPNPDNSAVVYGSSLDSASSRHQAASVYTTNNVTGSQDQDGNHELQFPESKTYGIGGSSESIFSDQERGVGTQGAAVSLSSYTYNSTAGQTPHSSSCRRPSKLIEGNLVHGPVYIPTESPATKLQPTVRRESTSRFVSEVGKAERHHEASSRG